MSTLSTGVDGSGLKSTVASDSISISLSSLKEGVRGRFLEWIPVRKAMGKKPKNWDTMFCKQIEWLKQFNEADQMEVIDQSIRNNWQGLIAPKRDNKFGQAKKIAQPWQTPEADREYERTQAEVKAARQQGLL